MSVLHEKIFSENQPQSGKYSKVWKMLNLSKMSLLSKHIDVSVKRFAKFTLQNKLFQTDKN